jgi:hypothetical protein
MRFSFSILLFSLPAALQWFELVLILLLSDGGDPAPTVDRR